MNTDSTSFYTILGLNKGASAAEIKKAYKKQALKYHPDRNRGAKKNAAEAKFKEINAAYEILSDSKKKQLYDQYGQDVAEGRAGNVPEEGMGGMGGGMGGMGAGMGGMPAGFSFGSQSFHYGAHQFRDPHDVFASVFGGSGGGLEDLFEHMGGMGSQPSMGGGIGSTRHTHSPPRARGLAKRKLELTLDELCNGCVKKLRVSGQAEPEILTIKVKPGWKPGTKITFDLKAGGQIQFEVAQKTHKYLTREGNDLKWKCSLSAGQAKKGVKLTLGTPLKDEKVKLCTTGKCIRNGSEMTVSGKGMPIKGDMTNRGDLIVEFRVTSAAA